jgi:hypothetical protein
VEKVARTRANRQGPAVGERDHGGRALERAMNHVNNFPSHLVCMVHTAPGQGRVICVTPHNDTTAEWDENGCYKIDEWDNTEQIRKDFSGTS